MDFHFLKLLWLLFITHYHPFAVSHFGQVMVRDTGASQFTVCLPCMLVIESWLGQHGRCNDEAMDWMCGELWVSSWQRRETSSPKQPGWLWVPSSSVATKCLLTAVKGLGSEADHSSLSSVEAKNEWYFTSSPPCFHSVHRDLDLDIIIQRIMCTEICLWVVPQYGVTLQTMLIILAPVLSTSDPMQHFNLLGLFVPTLGVQFR